MTGKYQFVANSPTIEFMPAQIFYYIKYKKKNTKAKKNMHRKCNTNTNAN